MTADRQAWAQAVRRFSCPFCGRVRGAPCKAVRGGLHTRARNLTKPHENRLRLLTDDDPAIRGSFSLCGNPGTGRNPHSRWSTARKGTP